MRCPKCGYHSFDHLEACKKCGQALGEHKERFGLHSLSALPAAAAVESAAAARAANRPAAVPPDAEAETDFGFGLMEEVEEVAAAPAPETDGFSFDEDFGADTTAKPAAPLSRDVPADDDFVVEELPETEDIDGLDLDDLVSFDEDPAGKGRAKKAADPFEFPEPAAPQAAPEQKDEAEAVAVATVAASAEAEDAAIDFDGWLPKWRQGRTPAAETLAAAGAEDDEDFVVELTDAMIDTSPLASPGARLAAGLCDGALLLVAGLIFILAAQWAMDGRALWPTPERLMTLSIPYFLVLFVLFFAYFTLFHFLSGETPGKMLLRIRVEGLASPSLSLTQAFLRSVGGLMGLLPLGLGYLPAVISPARRGWNDRLAGTRVVRTAALPVEEPVPQG